MLSDLPNRYRILLIHQ